MNDRENFLSRWVRRKRDVAKGGQDSPDASADIAPAEPDTADPQRTAAIDPPVPRPASPEAHPEEKSDEPLFDISKLPSIESITAETDIRPFLLRGVPAALRQAALRRMWVADPKIRDFIEMAENQWDFTGASEIPGFDFSPPTGDIKRMIADIYGKLPASESETEAQSETPQAETTVPDVATDQAIAAHRNVTGTLSVDENADRDAPASSQLPNETVRQTLIARHDVQDAAPQKNDAAQDSEIESRRRSHGGAMPK
jgi:hypothetical protein